MKWDISFRRKAQKFPGGGGWVYVLVPKKYKKVLQKRRIAWGMYPITAHAGNTTWQTKLMMKKGGDYFVALKSAVRKKEDITVGDVVNISFKLQ